MWYFNRVQESSIYKLHSERWSNVELCFVTFVFNISILWKNMFLREPEPTGLIIHGVNILRPVLTEIYFVDDDLECIFLMKIAHVLTKTWMFFLRVKLTTGSIGLAIARCRSGAVTFESSKSLKKCPALAVVVLWKMLCYYRFWYNGISLYCKSKEQWFAEVHRVIETVSPYSPYDGNLIKNRLPNLEGLASVYNPEVNMVPIRRGVVCIQCQETWWRHQMETFSALLALCAGNSTVIAEFSSQRPVTRSFDVFLDLRLNKRLSKQSWGWWFETPLLPLWRHCNV